MELIMKRPVLLLLAALASSQAFAIGRLADITITDRDSGKTLPVHYHAGEYWVAGRPGAHYAIQIRNRGDARLLAVTSVDGVNVLTGEHAGFGQRGYVFDLWSGYGIAGWRKSDSQIAAFTFTPVPKSYAARTGRPGNVGVIGVALFRERIPQISYESQDASLERPVTPPAPPAQRFDGIAAAAPQAAPPSGIVADAESKAAARRESRSAPSLGTGHGRREHSEVLRVGFEREQSQPNEIIRIRYDSRENLVAMGVIAAPKPSYRPQPFPDESALLGYVPDP
jgi:hypothetical protein